MTDETPAEKAAGERRDRQASRGIKERWAYIVLAMISIGLSGLALLAATFEVSASQHKFCQLIVASIANVGVVQPPDDPKTQPNKEKLYENYVIVRDLGKSLGCDLHTVLVSPSTTVKGAT